MLIFTVIFYSCERPENPSPSDDGALEEQVAFKQFDYSSANGMTLNDIKATVEDGMLAFETVDDFMMSTIVLGKVSDAELKSWSENRGFTSMYADYSAVMGKFEADVDDTKWDRMFSSQELNRYSIEMTDGAYMVNPKLSGRSLMAVVSPDGYVKIAGNLNYFSDEAHILTNGVDMGKMTAAQLQQSGEGLDGVMYTEQQAADLVDKADVKFVNCSQIQEGVGHREELNGHRIIVELFTYQFPTVWSGEYASYNWSVRCHVYNHKKSGLKWIRTWTDLEVSVTEPLVFSNNLRYTVGNSSQIFTLGGYPATTTASVGVTGPALVDVAEADRLLIGVLGTALLPTNGYTWIPSRRILDGRVNGRRTTNTQGTPGLGITLGCL